MCEEESDDTEAVAKLFEINDSIHRTIERYNLIRKGDFDAASKIPKGTLGTSTGATKKGDNELSLIDLDGDLPQASANGLQKSSAGSEQKAESLEDDLLGLSFEDSAFGQGGNITLSLGQNTSGHLHAADLTMLSADYRLPALPSEQPPLSAGFSAAAQGSSSQPHQQTLTQGISPAASDPFSSIAKMPSRQSSPFDYQQQPFATPRAKTSLGAPSQSPSQRLSTDASSTAAGDEDDEWMFSTALPERSEWQTRSKYVVVTRSVIELGFNVSRPHIGDGLRILAVFSNRTPQVIGAITFQVAVTKVSGAPVVAVSTLPFLFPRSSLTNDTTMASKEQSPGHFSPFFSPSLHIRPRALYDFDLQIKKDPLQEIVNPNQTESNMGRRE